MTTPETKWHPIEPPVFSLTVRTTGRTQYDVELPPELQKKLQDDWRATNAGEELGPLAIHFSVHDSTSVAPVIGGDE